MAKQPIKTSSKTELLQNPEEKYKIEDIPMPLTTGSKHPSITFPYEYKLVDSLEKTSGGILFKREEDYNKFNGIRLAIQKASKKRFAIRRVDKERSGIWRTDKNVPGKRGKQEFGKHPNWGGWGTTRFKKDNGQTGKKRGPYKKK